MHLMCSPKSGKMWISRASCVRSESLMQTLQISEGTLNATKRLFSDNRIAPMLDHLNGFLTCTVLKQYPMTETEFRYTQCLYRYSDLGTQTESFLLCLIQKP